MNYCENCHLLVDGDICPDCHAEPLRLPSADDFCLLTVQNQMYSQMLMDIFKDNNIPCTFQRILDAGFVSCFGSSRERYRLYVPYQDYQNADNLISVITGNECNS